MANKKKNASLMLEGWRGWEGKENLSLRMTIYHHKEILLMPNGDCGMDFSIPPSHSW